ncbi:MAG: signal peptidase I [Candidatus Puniceispirillum sp.]|nr:signal peptidase I [Candidatus Puniceispirillum sp.]
MPKSLVHTPTVRDVLKLLSWAGGSLAVLLTFQFHGHFSINGSDSLPEKIFYVSNFKPHFPLKVGELVTFKHPSIPVTLLKRVAGIPGERVTHGNGITYVEGRPIGKTLAQTKNGKSLHPGFTGKIPEGFLFVSGTHARSFDSRYKEMGLIPEEAILGKAWALL